MAAYSARLTGSCTGGGDHANEVCWHAVSDAGRALCGTDLAGAEVLEGTLGNVRLWGGLVCTRCAELTGA